MHTLALTRGFTAVRVAALARLRVFTPLHRLILETRLLGQALEQRCWALRLVCCLDPVLSSPAGRPQRQEYLHRLTLLEQNLRNWAPGLGATSVSSEQSQPAPQLASASHQLLRCWLLLSSGQRIARKHAELAEELRIWAETGRAPSDSSSDCCRTHGSACRASSARLASLQATWKQGGSIPQRSFVALLESLERRLFRELEASATLLELLGGGASAGGRRLGLEDLEAARRFLGGEAGLLRQLAIANAADESPSTQPAIPRVPLAIDRLWAAVRRLAPGGRRLDEVIEAAAGVLAHLQARVDEFQSRCLRAFPAAAAAAAAPAIGTPAAGPAEGATALGESLPEDEACFWEEEVLAQFGLIRENLQLHGSPVRTPVASDGSLWCVMSDWPNWDAHTTFSVLAKRLRTSLSEATIHGCRLVHLLDPETVPLWRWLDRVAAAIRPEPEPQVGGRPPSLRDLARTVRRRALLLGTCRISLEPAEMLRLWLAVFYRLHPVPPALPAESAATLVSPRPPEFPSFDVITRLVLIWHRTDVFPSEAWPECAEIAYLRLQLVLGSRLWELGSLLLAPRPAAAAVAEAAPAEYHTTSPDSRKRRPMDGAAAATPHHPAVGAAEAPEPAEDNPWTPERVAEALRLAPQVWAAAVREPSPPGAAQARLRLSRPSLDRMSAPVAQLLQGFDQELPAAACPEAFHAAARRYAVPFLEALVLGHAGLAAAAAAAGGDGNSSRNSSSIAHPPGPVPAPASASDGATDGSGGSSRSPAPAPVFPAMAAASGGSGAAGDGVLGPESSSRPAKQRRLGEGGNFSLVLGALSELLRPRPVGSDIVGILQLTIIQLRFLAELASSLAGDPAALAAVAAGMGHDDGGAGSDTGKNDAGSLLQQRQVAAAEQRLLAWRTNGSTLNSRMIQQLHAVACINGVAVTSTGVGLQDVTFALGGQLMLGRSLAGVGTGLPPGGQGELEALPEPRAWDIDTPGFDWPLQFCYCYRQVDPPEDNGPPCRLVQCDGCFQWLHYDCVFRSGMDLERESFVCSRCCAARRGNALQPRAYQLSAVEVLPRSPRQLTAFGTSARVYRRPPPGRRLSPEAHFPEAAAEGALGQHPRDPAGAAALAEASSTSASVGLVSIDQLLQCIPVGSLLDESLVCRALDRFGLRLDVYERRLVQLVQTLVRDCWRLRALSGSAMFGWELSVRAMDRIEAAAIAAVAEEALEEEEEEEAAVAAAEGSPPSPGLRTRAWAGDDGERDASLASLAAFLMDVGGVLGQCMVAEDILAISQEPPAPAASDPGARAGPAACGSAGCAGPAGLFLTCSNPWPLLMLARYAVLVRSRLSSGPLCRRDLSRILLACRPAPLSRLGCLVCAQAHLRGRPRLPAFVWDTLLGLRRIQTELAASAPDDTLAAVLWTCFGTKLAAQ